MALPESCLAKKAVAITPSAVTGEWGRGSSAPSLYSSGFRARPSVSGLAWARDRWQGVQRVRDQVLALRAEAKSRPGRKGKAVCVCVVQGEAGGPGWTHRSALPGDDSDGITTKANFSAVTANPCCGLAEKFGREKMQNDTSGLWQVLGDVLERDGAGPHAAGPRTLRLRAAGPGASAALPNVVMARAITPSDPTKEPAAEV